MLILSDLNQLALYASRISPQTILSVLSDDLFVLVGGPASRGSPRWLMDMLGLSLLET